VNINRTVSVLQYFVQSQ